MDTNHYNSDENSSNPQQLIVEDKVPVTKEKNTLTCGTESLSKRAQKRLLKRNQWLETRPERRAKEKAKKRAKIEKIREEKGKNDFRNLFPIANFSDFPRKMGKSAN